MRGVVGSMDLGVLITLFAHSPRLSPDVPCRLAALNLPADTLRTGHYLGPESWQDKAAPGSRRNPIPSWRRPRFPDIRTACPGRLDLALLATGPVTLMECMLVFGKGESVKKEILVLGAGRMAGPCVQYLLDQSTLQIKVADQNIEHARQVVDKHPRGEAIALDVLQENPRPLVRESDIVVNLLPPELMSDIARLCIDEHTHMVSAGGADDDVKEQHEHVKKTNTLILIELGLDPGIDHMLAAKTAAEMRSKGAAIEEYRCLCGAIPSHEANDNPFGYKFAWAPDAALGAAKRPARYLKDGRKVNVPGDTTMKEYFLDYAPGAGWFEAYPNGNSLPYPELYGMGEVTSMLRGTYRFMGWCETLAAMVDLGALDEEPADLADLTYRGLTAKLLEVEDSGGVRRQLAAHLGLPEYSAAMKRIDWLGLLQDDSIPMEEGSPRDVISQLMFDKLKYRKDELDMVVMTHEYSVRYADGENAKLVSSLVHYGEPGGYSSIAQTTGLPVAVACTLLAQGDIAVRGVRIPVSKDIYEPALKELERLGISVEQKAEMTI